MSHYNQSEKVELLLRKSSMLVGTAARSIVKTTTKLYALLRKKPRKSSRYQLWGELITPKYCQECQTVNEGEEVICFACGSWLPPKGKVKRSWSEEEKLKYIGISLTVMTIIILIALVHSVIVYW